MFTRGVEPSRVSGSRSSSAVLEMWAQRDRARLLHRLLGLGDEVFTDPERER
jgi:hypothetical protein